ncbi:MAG: hypothetical protein ACRDT4_09505 [Micromonosporaceae bacterium]
MGVPRAWRLAICGLAVVGLTACGTDTRLRGTDPPPAVPHGSPAATPSDDGEVRITDQGSSVITDDGRRITYAVVLENTSRDVAWNAKVTLQLVDSGGRPVADESVDAHELTGQTTIAPGGQGAVTGTLYLDGNRAAGVRATLGDVEWWPVPDGEAPLATFTTSGISHAPSNHSFEILTFGVESDHDQASGSPTATVVFRDKTGAVIGGAEDRLRGGPIPPGRCRRQVKVDPVPGADPARTQVFLTPQQR